MGGWLEEVPCKGLHRIMAIVEQARRSKPKHPAFAIVLFDQHFLHGDYNSALATCRDVEKTFKLPPFPPNAFKMLHSQDLFGETAH